jgi:putative phosphoribosyl transferase
VEVSGDADAVRACRRDHRLVDDAWIAPPLFRDRRAAGRALAHELEHLRGADAIVVGLARGGVPVAAEVAARLHLPLDVVAVRKVGHLFQPEYGIGAVAPGGVVYIRGPNGLTSEQVEAAVEGARARAEELDRQLHDDTTPLSLAGKTCVLVDDGLATGATMLAAIRWARAGGASRVVAAFPVAAVQSLTLLEAEADEVACPHPLDPFLAVGVWYASFEQVGDDEVRRLLRHGRLDGTVARRPGPPRGDGTRPPVILAAAHRIVGAERRDTA